MKWAFQPSVRWEDGHLCCGASSLAAQGPLPASRPEEETQCQSDGLTVIRVAAFGQHNTGQNVSLACQSCPILDSAEITSSK